MGIVPCLQEKWSIGLACLLEETLQLSLGRYYYGRHSHYIKAALLGEFADTL